MGGHYGVRQDVATAGSGQEACRIGLEYSFINIKCVVVSVASCSCFLMRFSCFKIEMIAGNEAFDSSRRLNSLAL